VFDVKRPGYLRSQAQQLAREGFDVLHCHDHWMLDLGVRIKRLRPQSVLIYDSHELLHGWPLNLAEDMSSFTKVKSVLVRKYVIWRERANIRHADRLITVSESIAELLKRHFKLKAQPTVVRNIPTFENVGSCGQLIRARFGIPRDHKVLVFIGAFLHART